MQHKGHAHVWHTCHLSTVTQLSTLPGGLQGGSFATLKLHAAWFNNMSQTSVFFSQQRLPFSNISCVASGRSTSEGSSGCATTVASVALMTYFERSKQRVTRCREAKPLMFGKGHCLQLKMNFPPLSPTSRRHR